MTDFLADTRAAYDTMAAEYVRRFGGELTSRAWDRAILAGFAETVLTAGGGPVLDVGCGPGRIAGHLRDLGLDVAGLDLSPGMLTQARAAYPDLRFTEGSMLDLDVPDGTLAGLVAWYSVIHVPDELLPRVFAGFRRVLAPGGHLLLAFQVGDEPVHRTDAWGEPVSLVFHRRRPERVAELLTAAGLEPRTVTWRAPEELAGRLEPTPQAYLTARRPADDRV
ncbi:class I SAM-dependent DNA methyltransferase [Micromonospora sp. NPDC000089]|uniref:class I SAM-dependent DNA methyltransferase n=1 Tax=unclassified Micromonospora TaxID=2617518 RepID=UPI00368AEE0D